MHFPPIAMVSSFSVQELSMLGLAAAQSLVVHGIQPCLPSLPTLALLAEALAELAITLSAAPCTLHCNLYMQVIALS